MRRRRGAASLVAAALLAACTATIDALYHVESEPDGSAVGSVHAARLDVVEAAITEVRANGLVDASSFEGGWVRGEWEGSDVTVTIEAEENGLVRFRVRVTGNGSHVPYELKIRAARIAGGIARRLT